MKDDVRKYIAKRKRTDKAFAKDFDTGYATLKGALFNDLLTSVKEAVAIQREELKPGRVFHVTGKMAWPSGFALPGAAGLTVERCGAAPEGARRAEQPAVDEVFVSL